jgi:hypothetical protein
MRIKSFIEFYNLGFRVSEISTRTAFCISARAKFLEGCACRRRSISNRSAMQSNPEPWIILSQRRNGGTPALSWRH